MKHTKTRETSLIRSRLLAALFSSLLAALILLPFFTSAKGKDKMKQTGNVYMYPLNNGAHATVTLADFSEGNYTLTIEDLGEDIVYYSEMLKTPKLFSKIFDFSRLEDGDYMLKVEHRNGTKECLFTVTNGDIKVSRKLKVTKPTFSKSGNKAAFTLSNSSDEVYSIKVISPKGDELHVSKASGKVIKKSFDFSNVELGKYTVLVSSQQNEFAFNFENK